MSPLLLLALAAFVASAVFALVVMGWRDAVDGAWRTGSAPATAAATEMVSLVVPARDAATTLVALLQDLHAQQWPREQLEVLVVDDGSSDGTADLVRGMMRTWPALRLVAATGEGKKAAIAQGVEEARGSWVILTDADARCGPGRVRGIMAAQAEHGWDLILGPVETRAGRGFLQSVQADEQAALLGVAAGTALQGHAVLANGANLAFRKAAFLEVGGYAGDGWAGGDDLFLLKRMRKAGLRIGYLLDKAVLVAVDAEPSIRGFGQQRLRWAGKMRGVSGPGAWLGAAGMALPWFILAVSCSVTLDGLMAYRPMAVVLLLSAAWLLWLLPVVSLAGAVRRFLHAAGSGVRMRLAGPSTAVSLVLFSVYAPVIAVLSLFVRPRWKGRRI